MTDWVRQAFHKNRLRESMRTKTSVFFKKLPTFIANVLLVFFLTSFGAVLLFRFVPVPLTPLMVIRLVQSATRSRPLHFEKKWVPLGEISPRLEQAVIAGEDMRFFDHYGFDFSAIHEAQVFNQRQRQRYKQKLLRIRLRKMVLNSKASQLTAESLPAPALRLRGASTISQQVAKNVFLWPDRSWARKIAEAYFTGLIEVLWSKTRIMEVYLNVIELGDGIYGAQAAAQTYFHKPAKYLSREEAALLSAVLPNPRVYSVAHPSHYVRLRQRSIARQMNRAKEAIPDSLPSSTSY